MNRRKGTTRGDVEGKPFERNTDGARRNSKGMIRMIMELRVQNNWRTMTGIDVTSFDLKLFSSLAFI